MGLYVVRSGPQEDVQVWVRNEQQSAAFVNCTDAGGEDLDAVRYAIQSSLGVRDTVVNGFDMLASDAGTASRERYASLANQLGQCIANNTAVYGNNASTRTDVLFGGGLLAVKPVSIKLVSLRQAGRDLLQALSSGALQLTTADPFDVSVQLYDSYGYDITAGEGHVRARWKRPCRVASCSACAAHPGRNMPMTII